MHMRAWLTGIVIAVDGLGNAIANGSPCLTLSARAATARRDGRTWGRVLCAALEVINPGHIPRAVMNNRARLLAAITELDGL
jgi:hypothetical protein